MCIIYFICDLQIPQGRFPVTLIICTDSKSQVFSKFRETNAIRRNTHERFQTPVITNQVTYKNRYMIFIEKIQCFIHIRNKLIYSLIK